MLVLVMHGEDDQIVPSRLLVRFSAELLRNGTRRSIGFPHGMPRSMRIIIFDLLAFSRVRRKPRRRVPGPAFRRVAKAGRRRWRMS